MPDPVEHAAHGGGVGVLHGLSNPAQTEGLDSGPRLRLLADERTLEGDLQRLVRHAQPSPPAARSDSVDRYAASRPGGITSSGCLPRKRATSSGRRCFFRASTVAWATLRWVGEPSDLARASRMPAASRIWRTAPPAMTPVPGAAGRIRTREAPCSPTTSWMIVLPAIGTSNIARRAISIPFWIAAGTSFALP